MLTQRERDFVMQRHEFVSQALEDFGLSRLEDVPDIRNRKPVPLAPILIRDFRSLSEDEKSDIQQAYWGPEGVAHFIVLNQDAADAERHPLLTIAKQLAGKLPLRFPIEHPMELHPEAISRFGQPDGTLKIYDLPVPIGGKKYREQAETNEMFDAHNDGLGYGGVVEAFILYADSAPLWGGYTYFQNLIRIGLIIAREDPEAFESLFLPDAITALRPRGKGAICVSSPVFFVNENKKAQCFFRITTGEYRMSWRQDCPALDRAQRILHDHAVPFSGGSSFVSLNRKGAACISRNGWVIHGRTPFIDGPEQSSRRVLARKWFMTAKRHTKYKHVPGMHIHKKYARLYPEYFSTDRLNGEWNWNLEKQVNERID